MATTLLDGGTGTELRARGIEVPSHITSIWSAQALYAAPDAVVAVHRDYMEASADGGPEVWISWTLQGDRVGRLPSGETLAEAFAAVADLPIAAYLVNCCGANFVTEAIPELKALTDRAVGGYANSADVIPGGPSDAPSEVEAVKRTPLGLQGYTDSVRRWIERGAVIVGGCCSTGPSHTAQLRALIDGWGLADH